MAQIQARSEFVKLPDVPDCRDDSCAWGLPAVEFWRQTYQNKLFDFMHYADPLAVTCRYRRDLEMAARCFRRALEDQQQEETEGTPNEDRS